MIEVTASGISQASWQPLETGHPTGPWWSNATAELATRWQRPWYAS